LGADGHLYAYHELFREYLLQRLTRDQPNAVTDLHRRASAWYETQESWSDSVKHLLAAGDTAAALVSIERCADFMVQSGDMLTLLNWEQQLRSKLIQRPCACNSQLPGPRPWCSRATRHRSRSRP
jgi:LuxR family maltose regulon positive regulatory protein